MEDGADDPSQVQHWLISADGSWACQQRASNRADGQHAVVREGGQRRLWADLEAAIGQWDRLGRPARERFGLPVTPDGEELWIDGPERVLRTWTRAPR